MCHWVTHVVAVYAEALFQMVSMSWYNNININSITCDGVDLTYHHAYQLTKNGTVFEQAEVGSTTEHLQPPTDIYTWRYRNKSIRFSKYTKTPSQSTHTNKLTQPATTQLQIPCSASSLQQQYATQVFRKKYSGVVAREKAQTTCMDCSAPQSVLCFLTMVHMPPTMVIAVGLG